MSSVIRSRSLGAPPSLPLVLCDTPPALEQVLAQEGVAFVVARDLSPVWLRAGRFVVFDGRRAAESAVRAMLTPNQVAIDLEQIRRAIKGSVDPFEALVDTRGALLRWRLEGGVDVVERASRRPRAALRRAVVDALRSEVVAAGGIWARLAAFPFPFRSAFNLRVDLDEPNVDDYFAFTRAARRLDDCRTHFVSTHAYARHPEVMRDLAGRDAQSHGHFHVIYRDRDANRRNLARADAALRAAGIEPTGFAAPHGRWNAGLDDAIAELGYQYSSDFQLGYDDVPFLPYRADLGRFSSVLQVPIHPICEGLFLESDDCADAGRATAAHLTKVVRARIEACEPAFVYGHPEGRLARHPLILEALADEVAGESLVWRTRLTDFARWRLWRGERRWTLLSGGEGRFEVRFDTWSNQYSPALEVVRGEHVATVPLEGPRTSFALDDLVSVRRDPPAYEPRATRASKPRGLRAAVRRALDWETVTPLDELPETLIADRVKKYLRRIRDREGAAT